MDEGEDLREQRWPSRSCTCTSTPSSRCSTVRPASSEVVATAAADGQPAVGITDHGNMYGVLDFYRAAREADLTPVIGTEAYMVTHQPARPATRRDRARHLPPHAAGGDRRRATATSSRCRRTRTSTGSSRSRGSTSSCSSSTTRASSRTTGCLGGAVLAGDPAGRLRSARRQHVDRFQSIFGRDSFFVELQDHGLPEQLQVNPQLIRLARDMRAPLLATNDTTTRTATTPRPTTRCSACRRAPMRDDPKRFKFDADEFYLKTAQEMRDLFSDYDGGVRQHAARRRAGRRRDRVRQLGAARRSRCRRGTTRTPTSASSASRARRTATGSRPVPRCSSASSSSSASSRRWGSRRTSSSCGTSCATRATRGIRVGPGRGSAAGSCVAYCLRIVDIDPIRYDLLFERFLNPGRKQMPDIDMDFDSRYRGEMIKYAAERYGWDHVAQIITFSTIKARAAVRDAARVLGYPYAVGDKIAKLMPPLIMGRDTPLRACFEKVTEARGRLQDGRRAAQALRGRSRRQAGHRRRPRARGAAPPGRHPRRRGGDHPRAAHRVPPDPAQAGAGRRRSRTPRSSRSTRCTASRTSASSRWTSSGCATSTCSRSRSSSSRRAPARAPTSTASRSTTRRPSTCCARGDTVGVFQLEGGPMRALLRSLVPTSFEDVAALVALYRPGPMAPELHNEYADRKNGRKPVDVPAPRPRPRSWSPPTG